ncbi:AaceriABL022Wp [[Ashbya] aceris (nom. inval.)]|nr:AaceriABL022Wp [[Ashbya] aceris (nom. inval.)]
MVQKGTHKNNDSFPSTAHTSMAEVKNMETAPNAGSVQKQPDQVVQLEWHEPIDEAAQELDAAQAEVHAEPTLRTRVKKLVSGEWKQTYRNRPKLSHILFQFGLLRMVVSFVQNLLLKILQMGPLPQHVSFIMDGNRRYAKSMNLPLKLGHEAGSVALMRTLHTCKRAGIEAVSAYAFSIENFNRPKEEIDTLTEMLSRRLQDFANRATNLKDRMYGARLLVVGDRALLSPELNDKITYIEDMTKHNTAFTVYICLPYTTRNDIYHAMYDLVRLCQAGALDSKDISVEMLTNAMYLGTNSNRADILVRTSGHTRLSDYMLWQVHEQSFIEFSNCMWPDFTFRTFFTILLKWSFVTALHEARKQERLRRKLGTYARSLLARRAPPVRLEALPPPPKAISVTDR